MHIKLIFLAVFLLHLKVAIRWLMVQRNVWNLRLRVRLWMEIGVGIWILWRIRHNVGQILNEGSIGQLSLAVSLIGNLLLLSEVFGFVLLHLKQVLLLIYLLLSLPLSTGARPILQFSTKGPFLLFVAAGPILLPWILLSLLLIFLGFLLNSMLLIG